MDVVDRLWAQVEPTVFVSRAEWERGLEGWAIEPVEINGELAFATLTRGPEFHFASFGTGAAISMRMIKARLDPILEKHGFVTTRTPIEGAERQHRVNRLLGFHATGADEFFTHFRLDSKCQ